MNKNNMETIFSFLRTRFNPQKALRFFCFFLVDSIAVIVATWIALCLRFDADFFEIAAIKPVLFSRFLQFIPLHILLTLAIFSLFRMYSNLWEFASIREAVYIVFACGFVSLGHLLLAGYILQIGLPRSCYLTTLLVFTILTECSRFSLRFFQIVRIPSGVKMRNIMIIGGGAAADTVIREINASSELAGNRVVCIIDDDKAKKGRFLCGVRIVGDRTCIEQEAKHFAVDEIIFAVPSAPLAEKTAILNICKNTGCELKTLPGVYEFVQGKVKLSDIHKVAIEDLLGREPVKVELDSIMGYVANKTVLVTGGGGSIGSELCRQLAAHNPRQLIIFDIYENNAYDIQNELLERYPGINLITLIGSVRDEHRINSVFEKYRPQIVYHAAAHKHVPLMEDSPNESVKNNVFGTMITAKASDRYGVERFVMISTDKAVNPTNIMGASKRICEMIIQTFNSRSKTDYVAVRFGNVLGSNGSVIPLFKKQIENGGPVLVTHPDIIRYFMTIPEAVSLVLQAGAFARGGEIFVLDMGQPVRIVDLAKNLILLSGYTPGVDMMIKFTGLRKGEKLYEELLMAEEGLQETANKLIHIGEPIQMDEDMFLAQLDKLHEVMVDDNVDIRHLIKEIVPTYNIVSQ